MLSLPEPAYVSLTSATAIISLASRPRSLEISPSSLRLINTFLDHLLYTFFVRSKSTRLHSLRIAVAKSLPVRLASAAMAEAEAELRTYVGEKETDFGKDCLLDSEVEGLWKAARCMIYSTLGSCEESDLPRSEQEEIAPASAIYLTAVLEFIAEHALMTVSRTTSAIVQESDVERGLGTDEMTSRMYRRWRKSERRQTSLSNGGQNRTSAQSTSKPPSTDGTSRPSTPLSGQRAPIALSTPVISNFGITEKKQFLDTQSSDAPRLSSEKRYSLFPNMAATPEPHVPSPQSMSRECPTADLDDVDEIDVSDIEKEIGRLAIPSNATKELSNNPEPFQSVNKNTGFAQTVKDDSTNHKPGMLVDAYNTQGTLVERNIPSQDKESSSNEAPQLYKEKLLSSPFRQPSEASSKKRLSHRQSNPTINWKPSVPLDETRFLGPRDDSNIGRRRSQTVPSNILGPTEMTERSISTNDFEELIRSNKTWKISLKSGYPEASRDLKTTLFTRIKLIFKANCTKESIPRISTASSETLLPFHASDRDICSRTQRPSCISCNSGDKSQKGQPRSASPSLRVSAYDSDDKHLHPKFAPRDAKIPRSSTMELADFLRLTGPLMQPTADNNLRNASSAQSLTGNYDKKRKKKDEKLVDFLNNTAPSSSGSSRQFITDRGKKVASLFKRKGQNHPPYSKDNASPTSNVSKSGKAPCLSVDIGMNSPSLNEAITGRRSASLLSEAYSCDKTYTGSPRPSDSSFISRNRESVSESYDCCDYHSMIRVNRPKKQESLAEFLRSTVPTRPPSEPRVGTSQHSHSEQRGSVHTANKKYRRLVEP